MRIILSNVRARIGKSDVIAPRELGKGVRNPDGDVGMVDRGKRNFDWVESGVIRLRTNDILPWNPNSKTLSV